MKPTKLVAGSAALSLMSGTALLGSILVAGYAQASTQSFTLYGQINKTVLQAVPETFTSKSLTMTVTPASGNPGDPIEVKVSSTNFDIPNGPASSATANEEELDAVVHIGATDYTLRGSKIGQNVTYDDTRQSPPGTTGPNILYKAGWVTSSTAGNSSSQSSNATADPGPPTTVVGTVAGSTGLGTSVRGTEGTIVPLTAPGSPGTYTIGLKALIVNSIGGSGTAVLTDGFDEIINTDSVKPASATGSFATNSSNGATATNGNIVFTTPVTYTAAGAVVTPAAPTNVTGVAGDTEVQVSWTGSAGADTYSVTSSPVVSPPAGCTATASTSCTFTGLTNGTPYSFTVTATNSAGTSPASTASAQVTPFAPTAPGAPTFTTAIAGDTRVALSWTAPSSNGGRVITKYTVTGVPSGSCTSTSVDPATPTLACTVNGLTNGVGYTFTVKATNSVGDGPASTSIAATPKAADSGTGTGTGSSVDTSPRSASKTFASLRCETHGGVSNEEVNDWPAKITVTPGAAKPGSNVKVSVSLNATPNNGPAVELKPNSYRFESSVTFKGKSYWLLGPKNKSTVAINQPIFGASELPTVASGTVKLPSTEGSFPITVTGFLYNNVPVPDGSGTNGRVDTFDNYCNRGAKPATAPVSLAGPTVSVDSNSAAAATDLTDDDTTSTDANGGSSGLAGTGPRALIALALIAFAALQAGAVLFVRAHRAEPVTVGRHRNIAI